MNFAAAATKEQKKPPLLSVQLEGHVLLKIAKHSRDNAAVHPVVTGSLLGLDVGQTLEVTECFPIPVRCCSGCLHTSFNSKVQAHNVHVDDGCLSSFSSNSEKNISLSHILAALTLQ
jgi:hypothetical protein